ncbi:conserved oligomeric Golgi complex component [Nowakowskiella sp. JEL0407]|nr:conserved oligomeric Golgi complex component [Nowakowskiella sp. JEL0407]
MDLDLNDPYVQSLASMSLSQLHSEQSSLDIKLSASSSILSTLSLENYRSILAALDSFQYIKTLQISPTLHTTLLSLEQNYKAFTNSAAELQSTREKLLTIKSQSVKLDSLLRVPDFIESLVKSHHYDDAIETLSHIQKLTIRYPTLQILSEINSIISKYSETIIEKLILALSEDTSLPKSIRILGYFKKLKIDESELQLLFLQRRQVYFQSLISNHTPQRSHDVKQIIEITRDHLFDVITQFNTLFPPYAPPLISYISHTLSTLTNLVSSHLSKINSINELSGVYLPLMYFGTSVARFSIDFRGTVVGVFFKRCCEIFCGCVESGREEFKIALSTTSVERGRNLKEFYVKVPDSLLEGNVASGSGSVGGGGVKTVVPEMEILSYPVFAKYYNAYLSAYNGLRGFAVKEFCDQVGGVVLDGLKSDCELVVEFVGWDGWSDEELDVVRRGVDVFGKVVDGLVKGFFGEVFGRSDEEVKGLIEDVRGSLVK